VTTSATINADDMSDIDGEDEAAEDMSMALSGASE